jgi:signal recognition particle subunit SEC65
MKYIATYTRISDGSQYCVGIFDTINDAKAKLYNHLEKNAMYELSRLPDANELSMDCMHVDMNFWIEYLEPGCNGIFNIGNIFVDRGYHGDPEDIEHIEHFTMYIMYYDENNEFIQEFVHKVPDFMNPRLTDIDNDIEKLKAKRAVLKRQMFDYPSDHKEYKRMKKESEEAKTKIVQLIEKRKQYEQKTEEKTD